jgi:hypothetical protein
LRELSEDRPLSYLRFNGREEVISDSAVIVRNPSLVLLEKFIENDYQRRKRALIDGVLGPSPALVQEPLRRVSSCLVISGNITDNINEDAEKPRVDGLDSG